MTVVLDVSLLPFYAGEALSYIGWSGARYLAWRAVRAYERRSIEGARLRILKRRIKRLEASMSRVRRRVAWTADAQQFTTALLLDRPHSAVTQSAEERGGANCEPPGS